MRRILIIGDSISMGYTPHVQEQLAGRAEVRRCEGAGDTRHVLRELETWFSWGPFDVVHLNAGLHDIKRNRQSGQTRCPCRSTRRTWSRCSGGWARPAPG